MKQRTKQPTDDRSSTCDKIENQLTIFFLDIYADHLQGDTDNEDREKRESGFFLYLLILLAAKIEHIR